MTEALFLINNDGQLMSTIYYTITPETLKRKLLSDELIAEVIRRVIECDRADQFEISAQRIPGGDSITRCFVKPQHSDATDWKFLFDDIQVEILKKYDYKIEFFVSRDIPKWNNGARQGKKTYFTSNEF